MDKKSTKEKNEVPKLDTKFLHSLSRNTQRKYLERNVRPSTTTGFRSAQLFSETLRKESEDNNENALKDFTDRERRWRILMPKNLSHTVSSPKAFELVKRKNIFGYYEDSLELTKPPATTRVLNTQLTQFPSPSPSPSHATAKNKPPVDARVLSGSLSKSKSISRFSIHNQRPFTERTTLQKYNINKDFAHNNLPLQKKNLNHQLPVSSANLPQDPTAPRIYLSQNVKINFNKQKEGVCFIFIFLRKVVLGSFDFF